VSGPRAAAGARHGNGCGCKDPLARLYGPQAVCWTCWQLAKGGDGSLPEPEDVKTFQDDLAHLLEEPIAADPTDYMGPYRNGAQDAAAAASSVLEMSPNGGQPDGLRWQWADELEAPAEPDWIWNGYAAPGAVTLLAGKPKSGKSTLACGLAEALTAGAGSFLGRPLRHGVVVYLSEEGAGTLKPNLDGRIRTLTRDAAWPRPSWDTLIEEATAEAKRIGATVIVVDSLSFWSALGEGQENDSAVMQRILGALGVATGAGLAVVLVHHQRKGGGEDGDAVRGSGAIFAAVDMLIEVERPASDSAPTHRQLVATGRWQHAPPVLVVDHDPHERSWRVIGEAGDRSTASEFGVRERIRDALPSEEPGTTENELAELLELDGRKVSGPLRKLLDDGVMRAGEGRKGDPYRYRKMLPQNAPPTPGEHPAENAPLLLRRGASEKDAPPDAPRGSK
jgi:AAA domain